MPPFVSLDRHPQSPRLDHPGVAIFVPVTRVAAGAGGTLPVYGTCRAARGDLPVPQRHMLHGAFLTLVEARNSVPNTVRVIGDQIVLEDDIAQVTGGHLAHFAVDLRQHLPVALTPSTYFLHATFFEHVSEVVRLTVTPTLDIDG